LVDRPTPGTYRGAPRHPRVGRRARPVGDQIAPRPKQVPRSVSSEETLTRAYFRLAERAVLAKAERFFPRTRRGTRGEALAGAGGDGAAGTDLAPTS